jgi:hypothetical protein
MIDNGRRGLETLMKEWPFSNSEDRHPSNQSAAVMIISSAKNSEAARSGCGLAGPRNEGSAVFE